MIALPVVFDLDFLPYYQESRVFEGHAETCAQCHNGAYHRDQFPPDTPDEDLFCEDGLPLFEITRAKIRQQQERSLQN